MQSLQYNDFWLQLFWCKRWHLTACSSECNAIWLRLKSSPRQNSLCQWQVWTSLHVKNWFYLWILSLVASPWRHLLIGSTFPVPTWWASSCGNLPHKSNGLVFFFSQFCVCTETVANLANSALQDPIKNQQAWTTSHHVDALFKTLQVSHQLPPPISFWLKQKHLLNPPSLPPILSKSPSAIGIFILMTHMG